MPKIKFHKRFIVGIEKKKLGPGIEEISKESVDRWIKRGCTLVAEKVEEVSVEEKPEIEEVSVEEIKEVLEDAENHIDKEVEQSESVEDNVEEKPKRRGRKPKAQK